MMHNPSGFKTTLVGLQITSCQPLAQKSQSARQIVQTFQKQTRWRVRYCARVVQEIKGTSSPSNANPCNRVALLCVVAMFRLKDVTQQISSVWSRLWVWTIKRVKKTSYHQIFKLWTFRLTSCVEKYEANWLGAVSLAVCSIYFYHGPACHC